MNKILKRVVAGLSTMALAASMLTVSASAATTPKQRGIDNNGNSAGFLSRNVAHVFKELNGGKINNVIVATSKDYPDALSAGYVSTSRTAPILYDGDNVTLNYIKNNATKGSYVYLIGGTGVISSTFESQVRSAGYTPIRLGGKNRYETNLWCLKNTGGNYADNMLICSALNYPDALAAAATKRPVMIVNPNGMTTEQINYIKSGTTRKFTIVGGTGAVTTKVESQLKSNFGSSSVDRLGGANRYKTCDLVMKKYCNNASTWVIADGYNFQGALAGASLASKTNGALILSGATVFKSKTYSNLASASSHTMEYYINYLVKETYTPYRENFSINNSCGISGSSTIIGIKFESGFNNYNASMNASPTNYSVTAENKARGYSDALNTITTNVPSSLSYNSILSAIKQGKTIQTTFECYDKKGVYIKVAVQVKSNQMSVNYMSSPYYPDK